MFILSSLSGCAATCCAACACEACRGIAGGISRKSARLAYCGLFFVSLVLAWFLRDYGSVIFNSLPWLPSMGITPSKEWFGTSAVLRITLGNFLFFMLLVIAMIGVENQSDVRHSWHHEGWMLKFILWSLCILSAFFFLPTELVSFYAQASKFGSGFFLLVQMVILLDFTYSWNEAWVEKDDQKWFIALLVVTLLCFLATLAVCIVLFMWFTPSGMHCELNTFFISFTLLSALAMAVISIHPEINGSLLPASVIGLYCAYLCFSALSSEPKDYSCNAMAAAGSKSVSSFSLAVGCITTLLSVVYSALKAGSNSAILATSDSPEDSEEDSRDSPDKPVAYVYSFFHLIFAMASMYSAMLLTGWGNEGAAGTDLIDVGWSSVWVKMASQWGTVALYVWSLIAPLVLTDRDFY